MTSTYLTFIAKAFCRVCMLCGVSFACIMVCSVVQAQAVSTASPGQEDGVNYSRWPRRPELWSKVTDLLKSGRRDEAQALLEKEKAKEPLTPECEKILGELMFGQILSPLGSDKKDYIVRRGDTLSSIARKTKCSVDFIIAINNISDPGKLSIGDKFRVRELNMKLIVDVKQKLISLLDGETIVKKYPIVALRAGGAGTATTKVKNKTGVSNGAAVAAVSEFFPSVDKIIHLNNRMVINSTSDATAPAPGFYLSKEDCNELALLLVSGNEVVINY